MDPKESAGLLVGFRVSGCNNDILLGPFNSNVKVLGSLR